MNDIQRLGDEATGRVMLCAYIPFYNPDCVITCLFLVLYNHGDVDGAQRLLREKEHLEATLNFLDGGRGY